MNNNNLDNKINIIKNILKTEDEYIKNFSDIENYSEFTRYTDDALPDMYDYNCILINKFNDSKKMIEIIENEKIHQKQKHKDFCRVFFEMEPSLQNCDDSYKSIEIEHDGFYIYNSNKIPQWNVLNNCIIKKVNDKTAEEDMVKINLTYDNDPNIRDFIIRKSKHHNDVYMDKSKLLNCYICYYDNIPVSRCELFIKNNVAKIEDFVVLDEYQRRGIGTTVMQHLIKEAMDANCELIYLVADEDDTPKEMYMNMGFSKIYDRYGMLIKL